MRAWLLSIALGIVLFNAPPARADAPQQIIAQIADLRVQDRGTQAPAGHGQAHHWGRRHEEGGN